VTQLHTNQNTQGGQNTNIKYIQTHNGSTNTPLSKSYKNYLRILRLIIKG
jgi:hypothetical protein